MRSVLAAVFLLFCFACSLELSAAPRKHVFLGAGTVLQNMGSISGSQTGSSSIIGAVSLSAVLLAKIGGGKWFVAPTVSHTPFGSADADDGVSKYLSTLALSIGRNFAKTDISIGPGVMLYRIAGNGGQVELDNGDSTATFYHPGRSVTSRLLLLQTGLGWNFERSRAAIDVWFSAPFGSRRTVSALASYSIGIW